VPLLGDLRPASGWTRLVKIRARLKPQIAKKLNDEMVFQTKTTPAFTGVAYFVAA
jgi:hypothetical protein